MGRRLGSCFAETQNAGSSCRGMLPSRQYIYDMRIQYAVYPCWMQVFPGLGKHAGQDSGREGQAGNASAFGEDRLGRTESEEREYQYQISVDMMREEKRENAVLLETLKIVQGLDPATLYDNEISLLRESIRHKQEMINNLHSKCLEISQKTKFLELELHDQQDRTREERERLLHEGDIIENSIKEIQEDRQCAVQRLHQYKLLYSRTKEDRDAAETRMLRARDLVDSSRSDLNLLAECLQNTIKVSQDACEKNLNGALADLEASKAFWKSSLEKKTQEIDAIIRRYAQAKKHRAQEEERESKERLEAERIKIEMYQEHENNRKALENDVRRARHVQREQWGLICAAAGLEPDAPASAVIDTYETLLSLQNELKKKITNYEDQMNASAVCSEDESRDVENDDDDGDISGERKESACAIASGEQTQDAIRRDAIISRIEMSLLYLQEKLSNFFGDSSASLPPKGEDSTEPMCAAERLPKLQRRSSMLALHPRRLSAAHLERHIMKQSEAKYYPEVVSSTESMNSSTLEVLNPQINQEQLCDFIARLASKDTNDVPTFSNTVSLDYQGDFSIDQLACCMQPQQQSVEQAELDTTDMAALMGVHVETRATNQDKQETSLKTPDLSLNKPVLSREDVKARSLKIKAKLDKHKHYAP